MRTLTSQELEELLKPKGNISRVKGIVKKFSPHYDTPLIGSIGSTVLKLEIESPDCIHLKKIYVKGKDSDGDATTITGSFEYQRYCRELYGEFSLTGTSSGEIKPPRLFSVDNYPSRQRLMREHDVCPEDRGERIPGFYGQGLVFECYPEF